MKPIGTLLPQDWLIAPETRKVMHALKSGTGDAKFVGGCVRDALLAKPVHDIDIATTELPETVIQLLTQAQIMSVPLGVAYGSVLAVQGDMYFHITTLRTDLETDGRRAKVGFTHNWYEDAQRRDFTMNALYADLDGTFYDPCHGLDDIKAGRVKFIGDSVARIREDYLRILRFFRFHSFYGRGSPDLKALKACRSERTGLQGLSGERIWNELSRLLMAKNPVPCLRLMGSHGIWSALFENFVLSNQSFENLNRLMQLEIKLLLSSHPLRRLALLIEGEDLSYLAQRLRWSKREKNHLELLLETLKTKPNFNISKQRNRVLYENGGAIFEDLSLLLAAKKQEDFEITQSYVMQAQSWSPVTFPVKGQDLIQMEILPGPNLGEILKAVEEWWIDNDFKPNREDCLARVRALYLS
ncbi:MAG: CCA tRNA nucleotidyltransferase [Alphaproteobacteria bacterium]|nr:CCA tRNA nucleotidyltransferase [Alphaproteobacteria bacterium]